MTLVLAMQNFLADIAKECVGNLFLMMSADASVIATAHIQVQHPAAQNKK